MRLRATRSAVQGDLADFDTGIAIGGATLPAETYFVYGTPPVPGQESLIKASGIGSRISAPVA
ncbi:MAG: hypothetical protein ABS81_21925 [Pseudonocardia sp. SCN 72-86]|nr:MAG: hypothetical protein ABS81_21925 [Pseudonocardia sp. SCN 72-86]